jgi:hypothetical protein
MTPKPACRAHRKNAGAGRLLKNNIVSGDVILSAAKNLIFLNLYERWWRRLSSLRTDAQAGKPVPPLFLSYFVVFFNHFELLQILHFVQDDKEPFSAPC